MPRLSVPLRLLTAAAAALSAGAIPTAPTGIRPMMVGQTVPEATLADVGGEPVPLGQLLGRKQTLLVVYRGGWCYFCNRQLAQLRHIEGQLDRLGYQIVAVSPDDPASMRASIAQHDIKYTLLSDPGLTLASGLGLVYQARTDPKRFDAPEGVALPRIPLASAGDGKSGKSIEVLLVPGVYLVSRDRRIHHEYVNVDYSVRLSAEVILTAARVYREPPAD